MSMRNWTVTAGSALAVVALIGGGAYAANTLGDEPEQAPKKQEPVTLVEPVEPTVTVAEETTTMSPAPEPTPTVEPAASTSPSTEPEPALVEPAPAETTEEQPVPPKPESAPMPANDLPDPVSEEPAIKPHSDPTGSLVPNQGNEGVPAPAP